MHKVQYEWVSGKTYREVWDYQTVLHQELISKRREMAASGEEKYYNPVHHLILCEHAPVYTLGKSGDVSHLLMSQDNLDTNHIEFFKINRGGDITYHGPGQITGYPIFDMNAIYTDVHRYVRELEDVIIKTLAEYGIRGHRVPKYTGVWVQDDKDTELYRKICAIGVHFSRWVTMHGFAFNVNTDLTYFNNIVPCGIQEENLSVTSLEKETGKRIPLFEVAEALKRNFAEVFTLSFL